MVLALALWALHAFAAVNPRTLAIVLKTGGGLGALGARRRARRARPARHRHSARPHRPRPARLAAVEHAGLRRPHAQEPGQVSRVRSAFVEMELDHDTGAMRGRILAGRHEGVTARRARRATLIGLPAGDRRGEPRATYGVSRPPGAQLA